MIFEILICAVIIGTVIIAVKDYVRYHEIDGQELWAAFGVAVLLFFASIFSGLISEGFVRISSIEPISSYALETINNNYVLKNDKYYFKYNGDIFDSRKCFIYDISQTNETEPTVYECRLKHSFFVPEYYAYAARFYVLIVPDDNVKFDKIIPKWISTEKSH